MIHKILQLDEVADADLAMIGAQFSIEVGDPARFKLDEFKRSWGMLLKMGLGHMWVFNNPDNYRTVGLLGVIKAPDLLDGKIGVFENFWYVLPEFRGRSGMQLYLRMIEWAENSDVHRIYMGHSTSLMPDKFKEFYESQEFKQHEVTYMRELCQ